MGLRDRLWRAVEAEPRRALERGLSPADLSSLLLTVARERAGQVTPARILRRWGEDRFVQPSLSDPRVLSRVESRLWAMLPDEFAGVELSPVAPLGTCSAVATVDQNWVVSTVRGTEVVSDPTNALAVEAATRRAANQVGRVDVAACHRVLRAQALNGPGLFAHFKLFAVVSSMRDEGSGRAEAKMLLDHLRFWSSVLAEFLPRARPRLTFTPFTPVLAERFDDLIRPALGNGREGPELVIDRERRQGLGYYDSAALGLRAFNGDQVVDLGDGGTTTWTAQLLGDAKERCVVSCISVERLMALASSV